MGYELSAAKPRKRERWQRTRPTARSDGGGWSEQRDGRREAAGGTPKLPPKIIA